MNSNPCNVCGGTELNLVDGFYYCVECGTQDVNVRETVVEQTVLADGTFAHTNTKRLTTILKDGIEMSSEWYKWHAFNFILNGLTEELISLGAAPTVKMKVLWIWIRYIKKFQVKEEFDKTSQPLGENLTFNKGIDDNVSKGSYNGDILDDEENQPTKKEPEHFRIDVKIMTKGTILTILYVALNLDRSDIQLSDLFRFINEGRLSIYNCTKYLPIELNVKSIPYWKNFILCQNKYKPKLIRALAMTLFKRLELGVPIVPDLSKLFNHYLKELCLPLDFRDFVLSLVHLIPCDFLQIDRESIKSCVRIPDYEGVCMAYILMALKICFGLDCDYELMLSDEIDRINNEENNLKSYKLGFVSEPSDRLFSFREWYKFIQFRKIIVCKYYVPMARRYNLPVEDNVLMEHLEERCKRRTILSDDITMDILKKIPHNECSSVIPKREFLPTFTPLTTYTDVVLQYIQDPDLKLLLCEDFTQYSLKYASKDLSLPGYNISENLIVGVSKINKTINQYVLGNLLPVVYKGDKTIVFVRNCENKNWLETKPPSISHIIKTNNNTSSDKGSDHGYDSNSENTLVESLEIDDKIIEKSQSNVDIHEHAVEIIEEEAEGVSIFDDDFREIDYEDSKLNSTTRETEIFSNDFTKCEDNTNQFPSDPINMEDDKSVISSYIDPENINRTRLIEELIEIACKKYKIPRPRENNPIKVRDPKKRKPNLLDGEASESTPKKRRQVYKRGESKSFINQIISSYYENLDNDIINQISEHVKSVVHNVEITADNQPNTSYSVHSTNLNYENNENLSNVLPPEDCSASEINNINPASTIENTNVDDDVGDNFFPRSDPDFDKDTHDIKQLYLKIEEDWSFENVFDVNDVALDKIIDKQIKEFANSEKPPETSQVEQENSTDSEDDLPLSKLKEEKEIALRKKNSMSEKLKPLITRPFKIKKFKMWMRHYRSRCVTKRLDLTEKFDFEVSKNCPPSFVFVIRECASILDCSLFSLYKSLQSLEEKLLCLKD